MEDKIRLGGMALVNGVLVHGPRSWACAVRAEDGELKVAAEYKRFRAAEVKNPLLRGPARIAEVFALLPQVRRRLPEARLPVPAPAGARGDGRHRARRAGDQGSSRLEPAGAASSSAAMLSLAPAALALRGGELAAYHGAEHISIGSYEHGEQRAREHERCGSHLLGPLRRELGDRRDAGRQGAGASARAGARRRPSSARSRRRRSSSAG